MCRSVSKPPASRFKVALRWSSRNGRLNVKPVPNTMPSKASVCPSPNVTAVPSTDCSQGRTVTDPSATAGR